jgi:hypothetical protein
LPGKKCEALPEKEQKQKGWRHGPSGRALPSKLKVMSSKPVPGKKKKTGLELNS